MKQNLSVIISVVTMLFLATSFFIRNNTRASRIKRESTIQSAKTDFLRLLNDSNAFISFTHFMDDTILFYNNGTYIGMTAIVNDTKFYYRNGAYLGKTVTITE